jgi:hypothetical protein
MEPDAAVESALLSLALLPEVPDGPDGTTVAGLPSADGVDCDAGDDGVAPPIAGWDEAPLLVVGAGEEPGAAEVVGVGVAPGVDGVEGVEGVAGVSVFLSVESVDDDGAFVAGVDAGESLDCGLGVAGVDGVDGVCGVCGRGVAGVDGVDGVCGVCGAGVA